MKNRKKGFSLVELLIVLAVIAALIATITPVAMNAIRKSKATQVAQNLKTLATSLENAAYVNGTDSSNGYVKNAAGTSAVTLSELGRDIDDTVYGLAYAKASDGSSFKALIIAKTDAHKETVEEVLQNAAQKTLGSTDVADSSFADSASFNDSTIAALTWADVKNNDLIEVTLAENDVIFYYTLEFSVY